MIRPVPRSNRRPEPRPRTQEKQQGVVALGRVAREASGGQILPPVILARPQRLDVIDGATGSAAVGARIGQKNPCIGHAGVIPSQFPQARVCSTFRFRSFRVGLAPGLRREAIVGVNARSIGPLPRSRCGAVGGGMGRIRSLLAFSLLLSPCGIGYAAQALTRGVARATVRAAGGGNAVLRGAIGRERPDGEVFAAGVAAFGTVVRHQGLLPGVTPSAVDAARGYIA